MTEIVRDPVRDGLRDAVRARQIIGWFPWNRGDGTQMFTVRPQVGPCVEHDEGSAALYVAGLKAMRS